MSYKFFVLWSILLLVHFITANEYKKKRQQMVDLQIDAKNVRNRQGVKDPKVLKVMKTVPRHEFVPKSWQAYAYKDRPLPIGYNQTISQPYMVAFMTEILKPQSHYIALEVGTGSGYQAAVLSRLVKKMYTIEIIKPLARAAQKRLERLKYDNIKVRLGDGYYGWKEHGPYDIIIVTAAATHVPLPLVRQLKPGGKMCIPVGSPFHVQNLMLIEKKKDKSIRARSVFPVAFVPLTGNRKK